MSLGTGVKMILCTLYYITRKEYDRRLDIFSANLARYEEHNLSGSSWRMGVTQFSNLTSRVRESPHGRLQSSSSGHSDQVLEHDCGEIPAFLSGLERERSADRREEPGVELIN